MGNTTQLRCSIRESKSRRLALKLNIGVEVETREREPCSPLSAARLRRYPTDSSVRDIVTERRLI